MKMHFEGVSFRRQQTLVLTDVSATFEPGTVTAVIGENGAGKSTLLDLAAGIIVPSNGRVALDATDLRQMPPATRAAMIASIGQQAPAIGGIDVVTRIAQGLAARRGAQAFVDEITQKRVGQIAEEVGVSSFLERSLTALSGGERARVEVARALVDQDANVVVLDEPLAGVDIRHRESVVAALRRRASQGAAVIASFHDLGAASGASDAVLALKGGRLVRHGPKTDVLTPEGLFEIFGVSGQIVDDGTHLGALFARPN